MKKSFKPNIVLISSLLVLITIILLISQSLRLKYEALQRDLAQLQNQLKTEKTFMVKLIANYQMLSAEDKIKKYASSELALVEAGQDTMANIRLITEDIVKINVNLKLKDE